ncbi:MAG TPA: hypothetical protein ENI89_11450 [Desulfobulbus sp.]|nr:hypothetical protein [Desulfobulbus sp.]
MDRFCRVWAVLLVLLLAGCARQVPTLYRFADLPARGSCRIALLPLVDKGSYPRGATILSKVLRSELVSSGHFRVVQEGDILDLYRQLLLYPNRQPNQEQLRIIGGRLGIGLFVGGDILEMRQGQAKGGIAPDTDLTMILRIYDGGTGRLLWSTYHRRQGSHYQKVLHFGRINTVTGLARQMAREVIGLWLEEGMEPCAR